MIQDSSSSGSQAMNNDLNFLVPVNVHAKFQLIPGFGKKELGILAISVFIGVILFLFLGAFKSYEYIKKTDLKLEQTIGLSQEELSKDIITFERDLVAAPIRLIVGSFFPICVYFLFKVDKYSSVSLYTQIKYKKTFDKSQKRYLYIFNSGAEG